MKKVVLNKEELPLTEINKDAWFGAQVEDGKPKSFLIKNHNKSSYGYKFAFPKNRHACDIEYCSIELAIGWALNNEIQVFQFDTYEEFIQWLAK